MRKLLQLLLILPLSLGLASCTGDSPTPVQAPAVAGDLCHSRVCELVNRARVRHDLRPLQQTARLSDVARAWSRQMALSGVLQHNPLLATQIGDYAMYGENVGQGPDVLTVHNAFMGSPGHRDNILTKRYRRIGVGRVEDSSGTVWITQVFKDPS